MSYPAGSLRYKSQPHPHQVEGYTVYKCVTSEEVTDFSSQVGWNTQQDDIGGMSGSRNVSTPIYDTKIIQVVCWIAIPDHLVHEWEAQFPPE
jgi:hypothetical protein